MSVRTGQPAFWDPRKDYYDFRTYLRHVFGARVAKLPIDAGFTCPNRDGTGVIGGCVFCDGRGSRLRRSGPLPGVTEQLRAMEAKYRALGFSRFIPYFQTFTNTHAPLARLEALWDEALVFSPAVVGLAVGTRPDCVPDETLDLLAGYRRRARVHLELGLQSAHPATALDLRGRGRSEGERYFVEKIGDYVSDLSRSRRRRCVGASIAAIRRGRRRLFWRPAPSA